MCGVGCRLYPNYLFTSRVDASLNADTYGEKSAHNFISVNRLTCMPIYRRVLQQQTRVNRLTCLPSTDDHVW